MPLPEPSGLREISRPLGPLAAHVGLELVLMSDSNWAGAANPVKTTLSPGVAASSASVSIPSWHPHAWITLACWMRWGTESPSQTSQQTASSSPLCRKPREVASYERSLFLHEQGSAQMRSRPRYSSARIW